MTATQYNRVNELLSEYSSLAAALEAAEAEIKTVQLAAAQDLLPKHAACKVALTNLEEALQRIADEHYEALFPTEEKRTHKTPFGDLQYRKSSSLEADDEEKSLLKIKLACQEELAGEAEGRKPRFSEEQLIRTREELNLDALGGLDDVTLAALGIRRVRKDNFKVVPFTMKSDKPAKGKRTGKLQEAA
jgi:hypothetical protein